MELFKKKNVTESADRPKPPVQRRLTLDLQRAEGLAAMLASSRASEIIEVSDMLAGIYINDWERLSRFWEDSDGIEAFLEQFCKLSESRLQYWLKHYHETRHASRRSQSALANVFKRNGKSTEPPAKIHQRSVELDRIFVTAGDLSPRRDHADGREIPVVTVECVLLAIVKNEELEIGRKLRATGLDVKELERTARSPVRWKDSG